jgi:hypothetical protein
LGDLLFAGQVGPVAHGFTPGGLKTVSLLE